MRLLLVPFAAHTGKIAGWREGPLPRRRVFGTRQSCIGSGMQRGKKNVRLSGCAQAQRWRVGARGGEEREEEEEEEGLGV